MSSTSTPSGEASGPGKKTKPVATESRRTLPIPVIQNQGGSSSKSARTYSNSTSNRSSLTPLSARAKLSTMSSRHRMNSDESPDERPDNISSSCSPPTTLLLEAHIQPISNDIGMVTTTSQPPVRMMNSSSKRNIHIQTDTSDDSASNPGESDIEFQSSSFTTFEDSSSSSSVPTSARRTKSKNSTLPSISESDVESSYTTDDASSASFSHKSVKRKIGLILPADHGYESESALATRYSPISGGGLTPIRHSSARRHRASSQSSSASSEGFLSSRSKLDSSRYDSNDELIETPPGSGRPSKGSKSKRPSKRDMLQSSGVCTFQKDGLVQLFGGTASKIIGQLLELLVLSPDREHIYALVTIFLHGIRRFFNAAEVLSLLLKYWDLQGDFLNPCSGNSEVVRSAIIFFLASWWEKRFDVDFGGSLDSARPSLDKFLRKLADNYSLPLQSKLKRYTNFEFPIPDVVYVKPLMMNSPSRLSILDVKPAIIAGQLCLLDMRQFQNINVEEFYATTPEGRPEWTKMLNRGQTLTRWFASNIVRQTNLTKRTKALKRTLAIAIKCYELGNFHGLMCAWGAVNSLAIHRLTKTFKKLSRSAMDAHKNLQEKLSQQNNFASLRHAVQKLLAARSPVIPWIELMTKNRNLLDEYDDVLVPSGATVTKENRESCMYSFSKFSLFSNLIEEFNQCQLNNRVLDLHSTQAHSAETVIQSWLTDLQALGEEELWNLSVQCEELEPSLTE